MPIRVARGKEAVRKVSHWTRGPFLHHGRYATIFQGIDNDSLDNQKIVVKSSSMQNAIAHRSITNERKILDKLSDCPQVVQFLGTSISAHVKELGGESTMNLFLEFMPKGDLRGLLMSCEAQKLSESVCKTYTRDLLHALSYMHARGIAHGNISGSNVLVGDRNVKLCDFGHSFNIKYMIPRWILDCHMRLEHQQRVPESFSQKPVLGTPMDIFSLGCLVCEMLMGRRARLHHFSNLGFDENEDQGPFKQISNLAVEIPKSGWEDKPHSHDFVSKCLIKEPKLRWTADQLRKHPWIEDIDDLMIVVNMNHLHTLTFRAKK